jgi:4-hydroxy-3-polyprenylbenzoate decarboxylase
VIDYRLPFAGVAHNLMLVKIHKSYPGQARKVAHAVWGLGQAAFTKTICVIDQHGPEITDEAAVAKHVLAGIDARHSFEFVLGPTETLDHATRALHFGSKVCIDATRPWPGEPGTRAMGTGITGLKGTPTDSRATPSETIFVTAEARFSNLDLAGIPHVAAWRAGEFVQVIEIEKKEPFQPRKIAAELFRRSGDAALPLIVFLPPGLAAPGDGDALVWAALANIDPERDLIFDVSPVQENGRWALKRHAKHIAVDATKKDAREGFLRDWPDMQRHDDATLAQVRALMKTAGIEMPAV